VAGLEGLAMGQLSLSADVQVPSSVPTCTCCPCYDQVLTVQSARMQLCTYTNTYTTGHNVQGPVNSPAQMPLK
jgi:hypothetical protein